MKNLNESIKTEITFDLKWAQTLDGQLCDDNDISQWITGASELKKTHDIRKNYDAVLVGAKTFLTDYCRLTVRLVPLEPLQHQPVRIILDLNNHIMMALKNERAVKLKKALEDGDRPTVIIGRDNLGLKLSKILDPNKVIYVETKMEFNSSKRLIKSSLKGALEKAERELNREIKQVLVEGGARTLVFFLENNLFNQIYFSIAPILTGGKKHRIYLSKSLKEALRFDLNDIHILGSDILGKIGLKSETKFSEGLKERSASESQ